MYDPHVYLDGSQISQLAASCPTTLHSLDIDLNRTSNATVDQGALDAITSSSSLRNLVLRLEPPDFANLRTDPQLDKMKAVGHEPIVNLTFVRDLFDSMRSRQASLESLQVIVGNWEDRHAEHGLMMPPSRLMGHWHCTVDAEGGETCTSRSEHSAHWPLLAYEL